MKDLNLITVAEVTKLFNSAQLPNTGKLVPRNGLYYVREVTFKDVAKRGLVPVIKANWKADHYQQFLEEAVFEIALSSLYPALPTIEFDYAELPGKTIQIFNMSTRLEILNGKSIATVQGMWMYDHRQPQFINRTSLVLQLIAAEINKSDDGKVTIACDERYGVDYEEEATRIEDSSLIEGDPANVQDWDYFPDDEFVEDTEPEN